MGTLGTVSLYYVGWEEVVVCNEKGKREVHYLLKRRDGKGSDLAVVGKERTARHMFYNFVLRTHSSNRTLPLPLPNGKLKSRREVLDWLSSVVPDSYSHGSSQKLGPVLENEALDFGVSSLQDSNRKKLGIPSREFLWVGSPSTCRKRRKHYHSFCRNGITISVHDFVYVLAEENKRLVAYLEDLYEDSRSNRMVVVRWFHKIDEVGIILPPDFNDREIFFSLCLQDLSVECIDGLATVLSPQHFEKYLNEATHTHWQPFLCHRQFDNDDITDFEITQVKGYWKQEILGYMYTKSAPKQMNHKPLDNGVLANDDDTYDDDDDDDDDGMKARPRKKHRRSKSKENNGGLVDKKDVHRPRVNVQSLCNGLVSSAGAETREPSPAACVSGKGLAQSAPQRLLTVGSHVEVLSQDSGIRGCWFRAMVIKRSKMKVKVRYEDIKDAEDEAKNVEEWVLASRIAISDELGVRLHGRNTIRPFPTSEKDGASLGFVDLGTSVDAWWHDGWWEGIVVRKESDSKIHVYFPGEKKLSIFGCNQLRRSQDWVCNKWNMLDCRPDIASSILSGLETKQDEDKSCDGDVQTIQTAVVASDKQLCNTNVVDTVLSKEERAACNQDAPPFEPQNGFRKHVMAVPNLAKDLSQLRWKTVRKRKRCRERSQRWSSGSSSSSREDMETSPDCQRYLTPSTLNFDHECCKYQGDSLLNVLKPTLTDDLMSLASPEMFIESPDLIKASVLLGIGDCTMLYQNVIREPDLSF